MEASQEIKNKKVRKANWTAAEMEVLVAEVSLKTSLLFGSFTTTITTAKKRKCWEDITDKINSNSASKRDWMEVKKKWTDMKSQTRKRAAIQKREIMKTGGGPPPVEELTHVEQMVVSLIPPCQIEGCEGGMESEECVPMSGDQPLNMAEHFDVFEDPVSGCSSMPVTAVSAKSLPQSVASGKSKGQIIQIEEKKLEVLEGILRAQNELVDVGRRRLELEEEKMSILRNIYADKSLSPIINFY